VSTAAVTAGLALTTGSGDGPSVSSRQVGAGTRVGAADGEESTAVEQAATRPAAMTSASARGR
jgi:hypothetical protein